MNYNYETRRAVAAIGDDDNLSELARRSWNFEHFKSQLTTTHTPDGLLWNNPRISFRVMDNLINELRRFYS